MVRYEPLKRIGGTRKDYDRRVAAVCQECTVGCGLVAYVKDEGIVDVQGDEDHPISRGRLCPKGTAFVQGLTHPQRITIPGFRPTLTRGFESFASWENSMDQLGERLRRMRDSHGPESLIIGCDPEAGLDFYLGARRFARLWGTPHVYHPWEQPPGPATRVQQSRIVPGIRWIDSRCLLVIEADLAATHPVAFGWLLDARRRGTKVIAADSRYTATLAKADLALMVRPGSGNDFGLYLLKYLLEEGLENHPALETGLETDDGWRSSFDRLPWDGVEKATGLSAAHIHNVARYLSNKHPATLITGKRLAYLPSYGCWSTMTAAMGWAGGWYPLDAGLPEFYPESDITEPSAEQLPPRRAPFPYQYRQETAEDLSFKVMISSGNCLADFFLPVQRPSPKMELVVHCGAFPNETCKQAHAIVPIATWAERDGLCCSNDRALQWSARILAPADASRSGLGFWAGLAQRFGWEADFPWIKKDGRADRFAFYRWLLERTPQTEDCDLSRLRDHADIFYWPDNHPGETGGQLPPFYTPSGQVPPVEVPQAPARAKPETEDAEYPLDFQSSRMVSRGGDAGNWWSWTAELEDIDAVQIHPDTASILGIENGDAVVVVSRQGSLEGRAWISRMVTPGAVWAPRRLPADRVRVHKKDQSGEKALKMLKENAP